VRIDDRESLIGRLLPGGGGKMNIFPIATVNCKRGDRLVGGKANTNSPGLPHEKLEKSGKLIASSLSSL
jgi:hypothetical protein